MEKISYYVISYTITLLVLYIDNWVLLNASENIQK